MRFEFPFNLISKWAMAFFNSPTIARIQSEGQEKGFWRWFAGRLHQAPVVQKVDKLSTGYISIQQIAQLVFLILIRWIVIYPVDNAIQRFNNRDQKFSSVCGAG